MAYGAILFYWKEEVLRLAEIKDKADKNTIYNFEKPHRYIVNMIDKNS
jgi:hypothetical protein